MGDGASIREMSLGRMTTTVAVDRGAPQGRISDLRSYSSQPPASTGAHRSAVNPRSVARTSRTTESLIRSLDVVGSLMGLILASPLIVVTAILIRITAGRPVLFRQERVGLRGELFALYKFRTMINEAEKHVGPVWASRNDDRVTPIGRILRKMRLDELPQLYNILRGDMSLVGPRPERPFFVERHKALQGVRLIVKPGLTGLAQIRGLYDLKPAHKVKYDCLYIQKRSLLLNVYILLRTIPALFTKMGW
jgi:lipopolysaccharide/colanic/teichoic acid biosynthesis glycosyltransferase